MRAMVILVRSLADTMCPFHEQRPRGYRQAVNFPEDVDESHERLSGTVVRRPME